MAYTQEEINAIRRSKLIALRESYGKNQKEFSAMVGIGHSYYNRLESGELRITDKTIQRITMALGVSWSTIMEEQVEDYSMVRVDEAKKLNIYENNCYYQLDRIIKHGGSASKGHMSALLDLLIGIESTLEYKAQFHDLCENEEKVLDTFIENVFEHFMQLH